KLLQTLGEGYQYKTVDEATLNDPAECKKYNAIFLTCAQADGGEGAAGRPAAPPGLAASLKEFVTQGGTLYASDLRYDILKAAFPEFVDHKAVVQGEQQSIVASVVAPDLREVLGNEMPLHF